MRRKYWWGWASCWFWRGWKVGGLVVHVLVVDLLGGGKKVGDGVEADGTVGAEKGVDVEEEAFGFWMTVC